MEPTTVAALVKYFNIASAAVLAFFAVFGIIAAVNRKSRLNIFGGSAFLTAFCVAALAAFALEATIFNFQHWLKLFAGPEIQTEDVPPDNPNAIRTSDGTLAEILVEEKNKTVSSGIFFRKLDRKVTSVFVDLNLNESESAEMLITWTDEEGTRSFSKTLYKYLPHENHTPLQPCGKVSELKTMFTASTGNNVQIVQVVLNRQIPFYFSGLRILAVSLLLFAAFSLFSKELRGKAARLLFEYKFDPASLKQNITYALLVIGLIIFSYICVYTSYPKSYLEYPVHQQYNKFLVDALVQGRTWLDYGNPEKLLEAERPYDNSYRIAKGYKYQSEVMWDWAWYKGKFYCYFGVVPAVILYVPYHLITGEYLSNNAGIALFASITIILLAMLWRFCVRKYMPGATFAFYALSFLALFFASGLFAQLRFPRVYSIVQTAGLMFAVGGCLLLLKSVDKEKINRLALFFACLCLALIAGCRPTMIFVSLLVPVVLWKYRSWKLLAFVAIPYVMVAIPLCIYNYVRFESIFDFGLNYNLTGFDVVAYRLINPLGKLLTGIASFTFYLLMPNKYSLYFPFVECFPSQGNIMLGAFLPAGGGSGMANFPIVFCLLYLFTIFFDKNKLKTLRHSLLFLIVAVVITVVNAYIVVVFVGRYSMDFAIFYILSSLFCAYRWCADFSQHNTTQHNTTQHNTTQHNTTRLSGNRLTVVYALLAVTIFVGAFLFVTGTFITDGGAQVYYNTMLYRYLEYSLSIFRNI